MLIALAAFTPAQIDRIDRLRHNLGVQREIRDDLHEIAPSLRCGPIRVETHRPIPLLALWLDRRPREFVTSGTGRSSVVARTDRVRRNFLLDRNDPAAPAPITGASGPVTMNRSWVVYGDCSPASTTG